MTCLTRFLFISTLYISRGSSLLMQSSAEKQHLTRRIESRHVSFIKFLSRSLHQFYIVLHTVLHTVISTVLHTVVHTVLHTIKYNQHTISTISLNRKFCKGSLRKVCLSLSFEHEHEINDSRVDLDESRKKRRSMRIS